MNVIEKWYFLNSEIGMFLLAYFYFLSEIFSCVILKWSWISFNNELNLILRLNQQRIVIKISHRCAGSFIFAFSKLSCTQNFWTIDTFFKNLNQKYVVQLNQYRGNLITAIQLLLHIIQLGGKCFTVGSDLWKWLDLILKFFECILFSRISESLKTSACYF